MLKSGDVQGAKSIFEEGRFLMAKLAPLSATVSAFEYKLGFVELALENFEPAVQVLHYI